MLSPTPLKSSAVCPPAVHRPLPGMPGRAHPCCLRRGGGPTAGAPKGERCAHVPTRCSEGRGVAGGAPQTPLYEPASRMCRSRERGRRPADSPPEQFDYQSSRTKNAYIVAVGAQPQLRRPLYGRDTFSCTLYIECGALCSAAICHLQYRYAAPCPPVRDPYGAGFWPATPGCRRAGSCCVGPALLRHRQLPAGMRACQSLAGAAPKMPPALAWGAAARKTPPSAAAASRCLRA